MGPTRHLTPRSAAVQAGEEPPLAGPNPHATTRHLAGILLGVVLAVLVLWGRKTGTIADWSAIALAALLLLGTPTSRSLSSRTAINLSLLIGLTPLLWVLPEPTGLGRVSIVLAVSVGAVGGWAASSSSRLRSILPEVRVVDVWPWVATFVAAFAVAPWLRVRETAGALSMLQAGWDNSSHFNMFVMIRTHGTTTDLLGDAPAGESWKFSDYPQGFHTLAAALAELTHPGDTLPVGQELLLFAHAIGAVCVIGALLLAAALCAMPQVRDRPGAALVAVSALSSVLLFSPLGTLVLNGFVNFYLASVLAGAVVIFAASSERVLDLPRLAAIGAALVGIAHGWILVLALALPAALLLVLPLGRARWTGSPRERALGGMIAVATAAGGIHAAALLLNLSPTAVLTTNGATPVPPVGLTLALTLAAIAVPVMTRRPPRRDGLDDPGIRRVAVVPTIGLLAACGLAAVQLSASQSVSYYFWKFVFALLLVSAVALVVAALDWTAGSTILTRRSATTAVLLVSVSLTQVFGLVAPRLPWGGFAVEAPGWQARTTLTQLAGHPAEHTESLIIALESARVPPGTRPLFVLPLGEVTQHPISAAQWFMSATGRWTEESNASTLHLAAIDGSALSVTRAAEQALAASARTVIVTDPATAGVLRDAVVHDHRARIISWS